MESIGILGSAAAQKSQLNAEARLAERQAQDVDLQATQASEARRQQLREALGAIETRRAASGLDLDSPTAVAIERQVNREAVRSEQIEQVGFNNQKFALRYGGQIKRAGAKNAMTAGLINAATSVGSTAAKALGY